jgi:hypothetical protein
MIQVGACQPYKHTSHTRADHGLRLQCVVGGTSTVHMHQPNSKCQNVMRLWCPAV